jgi:hypothetical protein
MFRKLAVLFVGLLVPLAALADDSLVKFKGGIGVIPVSAGVVPAGTQPLTADSVNRNFVRGIVPPPGQPWVIADLRAEVKTDGSIKVRGRGLLLAGNAPGTNANASVFATLICGAAAPFTLLSTDPAGVKLEANGDFSIEGGLDGMPPNPCLAAILLIRTAGAGNAWFAAGIPDLSSD